VNEVEVVYIVNDLLQILQEVSGVTLGTPISAKEVVPPPL
jgi:hypothetical protein